MFGIFKHVLVVPVAACFLWRVWPNSCGSNDLWASHICYMPWWPCWDNWAWRFWIPYWATSSGWSCCKFSKLFWGMPAWSWLLEQDFWCSSEPHSWEVYFGLVHFKIWIFLYLDSDLCYLFELCRYTWKIYSERLLTLAGVYGFWKHVSKLERRETRRYLEMFYILKFRDLVSNVSLHKKCVTNFTCESSSLLSLLCFSFDFFNTKHKN